MNVIITFNKQIIKNKFKYPYTKIEFVEKDLKVSRITAANYLNTLSDDGILTKKKLGVTNYYINPNYLIFYQNSNSVKFVFVI